MKTNVSVSGYAYCACAGCFEIVVTARPGEALCFVCKDAGCEACGGTTECAAQDMDYTDENEVEA